jgi:hypothetical protein
MRSAGEAVGAGMLASAVGIYAPAEPGRDRPGNDGLALDLFEDDSSCHLQSLMNSA